MSVRIGQFLFSGGTYQVEVIDGENLFWPFIQIDDKGHLLDSFCSCSQSEAKSFCPHLHAALQFIVPENKEPLHVRFHHSFWNALCTMAAERIGFDAASLKKGKKGEVTALSQTRKELFFLRPKGKSGEQKLRELLYERKNETEETSLKFSKLSPEELQLWREGRPSLSLQYELSFWSDLAKWLFSLQEQREEYVIVFQESKEDLPGWVEIRFKELHIGFYLAKAQWPQLVPALNTVSAPLHLFSLPEQRIVSIRYDRKEKQLLLEHKPVTRSKKNPARERSIRVGEWDYVPGQGFYPVSVDPLLLGESVPQEKMAAFFHAHRQLLQTSLVGESLHSGAYKLKYQVDLTATDGLLISSYLFDPDDLQKPLSAAFDSWIYLEGKGFYQVEGSLFAHRQEKIPLSQVSDFIIRHRNWLAQQDGFETHLVGFEAMLSFRMLDEGLELTPQFESIEGAIDVGEWIYLRGKGFYPKRSGRLGAFVKEKTLVAKGKISDFIHSYKEDLEAIEGFFAKEVILEKIGLSISVDEHGYIVVSPSYLFAPGVESAQVSFFGDFLYLPGVGFSQFSERLRLPAAYAERRVITSDHFASFFSFELHALEPFLLSLDPRLKKPAFLQLKLKFIKRDDTAKGPSLIAHLFYQSDIGEVSLFSLWEAVAQRQQYLFSTAGMIFLGESRFRWLRTLSKRRFLKGGKEVRLTPMEWMRLQAAEQIENPTGSDRLSVQSCQLLDQMKNYQTEEELDLSGLLSTLRPYQENGVRWLWFLYCSGLSGFLCDDMGLGKTHQAMALLAAVKAGAGARQEEKKEGSSTPSGRCIVVCPTSVLYHWQDLIKRFLPGIKAYLFYGQTRDLNEEFDLLLTSYGLLRTEQEVISKISFEVAIFDELQMAKNAKSKTNKALRSLKAKMRLGLTGTPIENRLLELKALFDVVIPHYFPQDAVFKELFVNPIEKAHCQESADLLRRFISPFLLRRKKNEVLLELPEKTEEIAYCALSQEQRTLYTETVEAHKRGILQQLEQNSSPIPYIHIFSLISTLKQICDHPALFHKRFGEAGVHESGKWNLFVELLQETRDSGQKLVVFTQYLGMMDILIEYLEKKKIGYASIRGSTRNRKEQLDRFQSDPQCEVFVASLQAVGVGVDLVAASVVIHYDRWWNPAKENQATDRVHRIGQSRGVQVFKMVTRDTIEEHIHDIIQKKSGLVEKVIAYDDQSQIKMLDRNDLLEIFRRLDAVSDSSESLSAAERRSWELE